jgi:hypothetical protein
LIVRVFDWLLPANDAVTAALAAMETGAVLRENTALVPPGGTVTVAGAAAYRLLLVSVTAAPPAAAALESVTVPADGWPPVTAAGDKAKELICGGMTVSVA